MAKKTKKTEEALNENNVNVTEEVVNENATEETNKTPEETVVDETTTEETNEAPETTNEVTEETVTEEEPQPVRRQRITLEWNGMLYDY